jgi:hypothetical protein
MYYNITYYFAYYLMLCITISHIILPNTSASGLLVPEDIIRPVVSASALECCITITVPKH